MSRRLGSRTDRGQTMVEFAMILPVFVLLLVGIFDVGRAIYAHHTLNNAAREAGRLAIVDQYEDHVLDEALAAATGVDVVRADVSVTYELPGGGACTTVGTDQIVRCVAVVTVPYTYEAATPIIGGLIGPITIEGESRFPVSINCDDATCPHGS
jgi:Flp pilus assembly protein TadG